MAAYRYCKIKGHGMYEGKTCPKCPQPVSKRSKKYGGKTIIVPPNMRASK